MRLVPVALAVCVFSSALVAADNPFLGTWKLNTDKSTYSPDPGPKGATVKFEQDGDNIRRVLTGTNPDGTPLNEDSSIPWDGKDHLVTKPPEPPITAAVTRMNAHTLHVLIKQDGKLIDTIHVLASKDGKMVTVTDTGVNAKGAKVHNVEVLDKQ
jgi:hypothetical protein